MNATNEKPKNTNTIQAYFARETVKDRLLDILGNPQAVNSYIASVLLAVANNPDLLKCTPASIYTAALRAATLRLSVDPGTGQAYLVPFKDRCVLIIGYRGLHDLAVRTNKYRYINVGPVYDGETVEIDRISGFAKVTGGKVSDEIIGYIAAFELLTGYAKVIYMTIDEIEAHAARYSKTYNSTKATFWKTELDKMRRKTVLRIMLDKWGIYSPADEMIIRTYDDNPDLEDLENGYPETDPQIFTADQPPVQSTFVDQPQADPDDAADGAPHRSPDDILAELGY